MLPRCRLASRLTLWAFAAALLLKSAVPMLASAAAGLQGKALAEVCDVYGVDMSALATTPVAAVTVDAMGRAPKGSMAGDAGASQHAHGHMHAMPASVATSMHEHAPAGSDAPSPTHHASHSGDHCALTGMVALAASAAPLLAAKTGPVAPIGLGRVDRPDVVDASARWASRLGHGPPIRS